MKRWIDKEVEILKNNYLDLSSKKLIRLLPDRTQHAIEMKAFKLKLSFYGSIEYRFWKYVDKKSNNECWNWTASYFVNGYGQIRVNKKKILSHRFSWEIHFGEIPKDLCVLHKCDNRKCVNPSHLFLGTHADNVKDRDNKNRQYSKLTNYQVKEIKQLCNKGNCYQKEIAKVFNVSRQTIGMIKNNKIWRHIE